MRYFAIAAFVVLSPAAYCQAWEVTGDIWLKLNGVAKQSLLVGYYRGHLDGLATGAMPEDPSKATQKELDDGLAKNARLDREFLEHWSNLKWSQVCDVMDDLYRDPANRGVSFVGIANVAIKRIKGMSQTETNAWLESLRRLDAKKK